MTPEQRIAELEAENAQLRHEVKLQRAVVALYHHECNCVECDIGGLPCEEYDRLNTEVERLARGGE